MKKFFFSLRDDDGRKPRSEMMTAEAPFLIPDLTYFLFVCKRMSAHLIFLPYEDRRFGLVVMTPRLQCKTVEVTSSILVTDL